MSTARTPGDEFGAFTCYSSPCNPSVVDVGIVGCSVINMVNNFCVKLLMAEISDHCSIELTLKGSFRRTDDLAGTSTEMYNLFDVSKICFDWTKHNKDLVIQELKNSYNDSLLFKAVTGLSADTTQDKMDSTIKLINDGLLATVPRKCGHIIKKYNIIRTKRVGNKIDKHWFSNRCKKLKRLKRNHGRLLDKNKKRPAEELRSSTRQYNKAKRIGNFQI